MSSIPYDWYKCIKVLGFQVIVHIRGGDNNFPQQACLTMGAPQENQRPSAYAFKDFGLNNHFDYFYGHGLQHIVHKNIKEIVSSTGPWPFHTLHWLVKNANWTYFHLFQLICEAYHLMKDALGMTSSEMSKVCQNKFFLFMYHFVPCSCIQSS